jgi:hypothetical protein
MSKLIFYADIHNHKIGDIINGKIDDEGCVFIHEDCSRIKDTEYREFLEKYFAVRFPYGFPVMKLEDFREQQIKTVLDD